MDEQIRKQLVKFIEDDVKEIMKILEQDKENTTKKGWHTDFTNAPIGVHLLLKSSSKNVVYRATLVRDKHGNAQRGICDTPWLDAEHGKDETQENFDRDGIEAWYMPGNRMDYLDELWKAVALTVRPEMTCSRKYPDGTVRACLKHKMTGEKEFIEWHETV